MVRVWAPRAKQVELVLFPEQERIACAEEPGGWFRGEDERLVAGQAYAFSLDGAAPIPDPRSPDQPEGVHGPSRLVDFSRLKWTDSSFEAPPLEGSVIYEMHVGTFTEEGTFDAIIPRLKHLQELGVTHVELMPVASFPGMRGWGYDGVGLFAPQASYGGPEGLARLVDACHARGLGVLLDVVYNHLGPSGNYLGRFGPYFTGRYHTPWGDALNYDGAGSDEVRRFVLDSAIFWLKNYHIDGLRLDAVQAIFDQSPEHLLARLSEEVEALGKSLGRQFILIGECDLNAPRFISPRDSGGYGLNAQWSDDFHYALHALLTGERAGYYQDFGTIEALAMTLQNGFYFRGQYSRYRDRAQGAKPEDLPGERFVVYGQNHDQVGNRPLGERLSALISPSKQELAAAVTLLSPFTSLLFMGEEWGAQTPFGYFVDHAEPELQRGVLSGRRREFAEFGWAHCRTSDPSDAATFARSKLDWSERDGDVGQARLLWYRKLIELRRTHPDLAPDKHHGVRVEFDEEARWLVLWRGNVGVLCNFGDAPAELTLPAFRTLLGAENLRQAAAGAILSSGSAAVVEAEGNRPG